MRTNDQYSFQEHGSFTIEIKDKTIEVCAFGAWNEKTSELFKEQYLRQAQCLTAEPWACLLNLTDWELGTGEILRVGQDLNAWSYAHNQRFSAIVSSLALHRHLIEKIQEPTKSIQHQYFTQSQAAKDWLRSLNLYS
ncbi:MAG: hypothetical protein NWQ54_12360 [Paraglaciecola sp.]|uniref:hypothetical protein n=1 Tax=Pseudomonadati TaxID=3379134 RepID=UPI00273E0E1C|nr:hypothetical protein [Paraglaciecola sp.]MDP5029709.1 hypothetical protein [Paraglaciecola sp.]MDP5131673.1 hypothetical protein [Paraglaciecola sp.]